jgi:hypothetical protein
MKRREFIAGLGGAAGCRASRRAPSEIGVFTLPSSDRQARRRVRSQRLCTLTCLAFLRASTIKSRAFAASVGGLW